jgi:hypothetical protein
MPGEPLSDRAARMLRRRGSTDALNPEQIKRKETA